MAPKVKFCSIRTQEAVDFVNEICPDYIGYIFSPRFKRFVEPSLAKVFTRRLNKSIVPVGVFVDESEDYILHIIAEGTISAVQLHGTENEDFILSLKKKTSLPIIKYFKIVDKADIDRANLSSADYVLLEGGKPGNAEKFDYSLLGGIKREFFLAGGLNPQNVKEAVTQTMPFCVDTSSGVETDGKKDYNKMKAFFEAVKQ